MSDSPSCQKRLAEFECIGEQQRKRHCREEDTSEEKLKSEEKREYNRINAARARQRTKDHIAELCNKVQGYEDKNAALEQKNETLMNRIAALRDENMVLRSILLETMGHKPRSFSVSSPTSVAFLPMNQGPTNQGKSPQDLSFLRNPLYG
jgi:hypothetical protein